MSSILKLALFLIPASIIGIFVKRKMNKELNSDKDKSELEILLIQYRKIKENSKKYFLLMGFSFLFSLGMIALLGSSISQAELIKKIVFTIFMLSLLCFTIFGLILFAYINLLNHVRTSLIKEGVDIKQLKKSKTYEEEIIKNSKECSAKN